MNSLNSFAQCERQKTQGNVGDNCIQNVAIQTILYWKTCQKDGKNDFYKLVNIQHSQ